VVGGFESCLPNCPAGTRLYAFEGNVTCLAECPPGQVVRETDEGSIGCADLAGAHHEEPPAPPPPAPPRERSSNLFLAFQLALGGAYCYPENLAFLEAGVTVFSERVAFNTTMGIAHNFNDTRIGWSYQMRFIFPRLFTDSMRVQPYLGLHAMSFNTQYGDAEVRPTRLYLFKLGIDLVVYTNTWTRLLLDFGGYIGVFHQEIAYIAGAQERQREEFSVSGGAQLALRWDIH